MVLLMTEEVEEKRIVTEFCHLLEKSKQLFNGLRDLPPYGYKQWQTYFCRTFDVYTKLWKFQQQHRPTLDKIYCLKRWQIGEIASKIGQLYYHYYLRTSELHYLNESAAFYGAIRSRGYYNRRDERNEFLIKKLRYLARFILVCLLLRRMKLVKELVHELSEHIEDYSNTPMYETEDHLEWTFVLGEVLSFLQAEAPLTIIIPSHYFDGEGDEDREEDDEDGTRTTGELIFIPTYRLSAVSPSSLSSASSDSVSSANAPAGTASTSATSTGLSLQEVLIVSTKSEQIKFSEYTIDMYRILQTLEREPNPAQLAAAGSNSSNSNGHGGPESAQEGPRTSVGGGIESSVDELTLADADEDKSGGPSTNEGGGEERSSSNHVNVTNNTSNPCNDRDRQVHPPGSGHGRTPGTIGATGATTEKLNPHKHLLYKPSIEQLLVYLSSSLKCLGQDGVLLLYISGDSLSPSPPVSSTPSLDGSIGGVNGELGLVCSSTNPFRPRPIAVSPPVAVAANSGLGYGYELGGISMVSAVQRKESQGSAGVSTDSKQQASTQTTVTPSTSGHMKCQRKDKQCLYPGDLLPFTRKPLFLVIDSENSHIFVDLLSNNLCPLFTAPVLILMSPIELPANLQGSQSSQSQSTGSLFTHFLHSPFSALASICQITKVTKSKWNAGQEIISRFSSEAARIYVESCACASDASSAVRTPGHHFFPSTSTPTLTSACNGLEFFADEFLRVLILRFMFCEIVLRMHKAFQYSTRCFPRSQPNLIAQLKLRDREGGGGAVQKLQTIVGELVRLLGVDELFSLETPSGYD